jgi:hypothetical protein
MVVRKPRSGQTRSTRKQSTSHRERIDHCLLRTPSAPGAIVSVASDPVPRGPNPFWALCFRREEIVRQPTNLSRLLNSGSSAIAGPAQCCLPIFDTDRRCRWGLNRRLHARHRETIVASAAAMRPM